MKTKWINTTLLIASTCLISACAQKETMAGAPVQVEKMNRRIIQIANFAVETQQKKTDTKLVFVKVLDASSQVVAGANYKITMEVTEAGKTKKAEAVVWEQTWRKPDPLQLTSWTWLD